MLREPANPSCIGPIRTVLKIVRIWYNIFINLLYNTIQYNLHFFLFFFVAFFLVSFSGAFAKDISGPNFSFPKIGGGGDRVPVFRMKWHLRRASTLEVLNSDFQCARFRSENLVLG